MKPFEVLHSTWLYPVEGEPVYDHCFFTKDSDPAAYTEFDACRKSPDVQTIISMDNDSCWVSVTWRKEEKTPDGIRVTRYMIEGREAG